MLILQPSALKEAAEEEEAHDFVEGTCELIGRLSEIKELRERLFSLGVVPPLVALVLLSPPHAAACK